MRHLKEASHFDQFWRTAVSKSMQGRVFDPNWLQRLLKNSLTFMAASRHGQFFRVDRLFCIAFLVLAGLLYAPQTHYSLRLLRRN